MEENQIKNLISGLEERIKALEDYKNNPSSEFQQNVYDSMVRSLEVNTPLGIGRFLTNDNSAIFQVVSSNKGVRFPTMTTSQRDAIIRPEAGLLIFNTTTGVYNFHNGTSWGAI